MGNAELHVGAWPHSWTIELALADGTRVAAKSNHVGEHKAVANNLLPHRNLDRPLEQRPVIHKRVEFPTLATRVHGCRKVAQQRPIKLTAGKGSIELIRVDAGKLGAKAGRDHLLRQRP